MRVRELSWLVCARWVCQHHHPYMKSPLTFWYGFAKSLPFLVLWWRFLSLEILFSTERLTIHDHSCRVVWETFSLETCIYDALNNIVTITCYNSIAERAMYFHRGLYMFLRLKGQVIANWKHIKLSVWNLPVECLYMKDAVLSCLYFSVYTRVMYSLLTSS